MNLGREIVSSLLDNGDIEILLEHGYSTEWLSSPDSGVVFQDKDKNAYQWILSYYTRHRTIPQLQVFRSQFPQESYRLSSSVIAIPELADLMTEKVTSYKVAEIVGKVIILHDEGRIDDAVKFLKSESVKLSSGRSHDLAGYDVTSSDFDLEKMLNTRLERGIPFGVDKIDEAYWGFQPGQLVTLMGRQKSGKSWMTLNSAYNAWLEGYSVLFFSVEMGEELLHQRLLSLGSHVSPSRMRRGVLTDPDKDKVREFQSRLSDNSEPGRFTISRKKTMISTDDVAEEVRKYRPHIVYIDGFSFMIDRVTRKMTDDWQSNENVAAELKSMAMEENIVIFVNTQVQEKQYSSARGIEARAIQGGTGLLKASDYVIGQDKAGNLMTFTSQRSRFEEFDEVNVEVDFDSMTFAVISPAEKLEKMGV